MPRAPRPAPRAPRRDDARTQGQFCRLKLTRDVTTPSITRISAPAGQARLLRVLPACLPETASAADGPSGCNLPCCRPRSCSPWCSASSARGARTAAASTSTAATPSEPPGSITVIELRRNRHGRRADRQPLPPDSQRRAPRPPDRRQEDGSRTARRPALPAWRRFAAASQATHPTWIGTATASRANRIARASAGRASAGKNSRPAQSGAANR